MIYGRRGTTRHVKLHQDTRDSSEISMLLIRLEYEFVTTFRALVPFLQVYSRTEYILILVQLVDVFAIGPLLRTSHTASCASTGVGGGDGGLDRCRIGSIVISSIRSR